MYSSKLFSFLSFHLGNVAVPVDVELAEDLDGPVYGQLLVQALVHVEGPEHLHQSQSGRQQGSVSIGPEVTHFMPDWFMTIRKIYAKFVMLFTSKLKISLILIHILPQSKKLMDYVHIIEG